MATSNLRSPPHAVEAEQSLLGGLMISSDAWFRIEGDVLTTDFYREPHQRIFAAIADLRTRSQPADAVTVAEQLERDGVLDTMGGLSYLAMLANGTPSAAHIESYATIVAERARLRELITTSTAAIESAYDHVGRDIDSILDQAEQDMLHIRQNSEQSRVGLATLASVASNWVQDFDQRYNSDQDINGASTGLTDLDQHLLGMRPGDLVMVAGRPSMGKTAFAQRLALGCAASGNVAFFSLEMPRAQIYSRFVAMLGGVSMEALNAPTPERVQEDDWERITRATATIKSLPIFIDDRAALTTGQIRATARRLHRQQPLSAVIVDYLQLITGGNRDNRNLQVGEYTKALKALAKELGCPVIVLAQLNRGLEARTDKRPRMSDLRDSGEIEQDADTILMLYRDEVYHDDSPEQGTAEILVTKQRNGAIGTVRTAFKLDHACYHDLASGWQPKLPVQTADSKRRPPKSLLDNFTREHRSH